MLLAATTSLRKDDKFHNIKIFGWLYKEEMGQGIILRNQCAKLNEGSSPCKDGRIPYVVISGHIMKRTENGKLRKFDAAEDSKSSDA